MPGSYKEINQYETEIINLYNQRMTLRAIAEKLGFTYKQVQEFKISLFLKNLIFYIGCLFFFCLHNLG